MNDVTATPSGADATPAPSMSTFDTIMADLGGGGDGSSAVPETPVTPPIDPAVAGEVADVPDDDAEVAPIPEAVEKPVEAKTDDDDAKPEIENLNESRWKRVHKGYKYAQELGKALGVVGEDGKVDLSLFPSMDDIKAMRDAHSVQTAMEHDFISGNPQNAQQMLHNLNEFAAREAQQGRPNAMQVLAAQMPEYLAKANPGAYMQMAQPVLGRHFQNAYQNAARITDEAYRTEVINGLLWAEWHATGGERGGRSTPVADIERMIASGGGTQQQAAPQQQSPEAQELQRTRQELQQIRQQTQQAQWRGFMGGVDSEKNASAHAQIDKSLETLKNLYPNERAFGAMRKDFVDEVAAAMNADTYSKQQYGLLLEKMRDGVIPTNQQALVNQYRSWFSRGLAAVSGKFITETSKGLKQMSDARNTQLDKNASKVGPMSSGAPRPQSIMPKIERGQGESASAYTKRMMEHDLAS